LDRAVRCEPETLGDLSTRMANPVLVFGKEVVLELKFTDRFPDWFKQLVRVFGLMQCGAAKYVDGVTLVGEYRFDRAFVLTHPVLTSPEFEPAAPRRWTSNAMSKPTDDR